MQPQYGRCRGPSWIARASAVNGLSISELIKYAEMDHSWIPVTVQPVNRFLLDLIPGCQIGLVLMTVEWLSTEHLRFTFVRLPATYLTSSSRLFPVRSPPGILIPEQRRVV